MSKSNYASRKTLEHMLGISAWPMPSGIVLGLATAASATSVTKLPTGNGYAPINVPGGAWGFLPDGRAQNATEISFGVATADKGRPTHFYLEDGSGNLLRFGTLPGGGFDYNASVRPYFDPGDLICEES